MYLYGRNRVREKNRFGRLICPAAYLFVVFAVGALIPDVVSAAPPKYGGGGGVEDNPYLITTADHLVELSKKPSDWGRHFMQGADLSFADANMAGFLPIGDAETPFTGTYSGADDVNDYVIFDFSLSFTELNNIGLFGCVAGADANISSVQMIAPVVDGGTGSNVGALVGYLHKGTVANCLIDGAEIYGGMATGGLVGTSVSGKIETCDVYGVVTGEYLVGGIAGRVTGTGAVSAAINACSFLGDVYARRPWAGGLVGKAYNATIQHSLADCFIDGHQGVGGLFGKCHASDVNECYAITDAAGAGQVGGLIGNNLNSTIRHSYCSGSVIGGDNVGGFAGRDRSCVYEACFWDSSVIGRIGDVQGRDVEGIFAATMAEMVQWQTYEDVGWKSGNQAWLQCHEDFYYPPLYWEECRENSEYDVDTNSDGAVDFYDLAAAVPHWRQTDCTLPDRCDKADNTADGRVDWKDIIRIAENWLK